jgi:2-C-methyl-D-erythritol 4-phosphate cytidylyltransferase
VVSSTVDREGLVTVQTPQAFDAQTLRAAHRAGGEATDDAGLLERLGAPVGTVAGDIRNVKITRPEDLALAELLLSAVHG